MKIERGKNRKNRKNRKRKKFGVEPLTPTKQHKVWCPDKNKSTTKEGAKKKKKEKKGV